MFKLTQARNWIRIHRRKAISISSVGPNPTIHLGHEFPQNLIFKIFEKDHKTVLKIPPPSLLSLSTKSPTLRLFRTKRFKIFTENQTALYQRSNLIMRVERISIRQIFLID